MAYKKELGMEIDCRIEGCPGKYVFSLNEIFSTVPNGMSCGRASYGIENKTARCSVCGSDWIFSEEKKMGCKYVKE